MNNAPTKTPLPDKSGPNRPRPAAISRAAGPRPARLATARRGKPIIWAAGLVLVAGGAAVAASAALAAGSKHDVLILTRPVQAGRTISAADLRPERIAADASVDTVPADASSTVVGQRARVDLLPGSLLNRAALGGAGVPAAGQVLLGVAFKPGQLPGRSLASGDRAELVTTKASSAITAGSTGKTPDRSTATPLLVTVDAQQPAAADGSVVVDLVLPVDAAAAAAQNAADGRLVLVLLPRDGS